MLQATYEIFIKFTTYVYFVMDMNELDIEVKGQGHSETRYGQICI